jgi:hypothetical protein
MHHGISAWHRRIANGAGLRLCGHTTVVEAQQMLNSSPRLVCRGCLRELQPEDRRHSLWNARAPPKWDLQAARSCCLGAEPTPESRCIYGNRDLDRCDTIPVSAMRSVCARDRSQASTACSEEGVPGIATEESRSARAIRAVSYAARRPGSRKISCAAFSARIWWRASGAVFRSGWALHAACKYARRMLAALAYGLIRRIP